MVRLVPFESLQKAYKHITCGGNLIPVCLILGIDLNLRSWNLKLAREEILCERGRLQKLAIPRLEPPPTES